MENYFVIAFALSVIIYSIMYLYLRKRRAKISFIKFIGEFTFIGYLIMLILVTLVMDYDPNVVRESDLIPFKDIIKNIILQENFIGLKQFNLNIIMFIPLGMLIPIIINKKRWSFKAILFLSFIVTFLIETCQYFTGRAFDVNDIIANSIGGLVGYAVYVLLFWVTYCIFRRKHKNVLVENKYLKERTISLIVVIIFIVVATYSIIIGG
ncbi:VanZ family protein [Haloimpatiens massiliensis]|uniref:VanZ family protein n=1 Tax=Haloimpatiens massiliensis TaxID=1658110 RepID=UPI0015E0E950|nr:VanZ family protein [Haloimpatiens massiliensis]